MKQEKEMLRNSEKKASDEVCSLSERVHRLQVFNFDAANFFIFVSKNQIMINNMLKTYFSCTCFVAAFLFYLYLCLGQFGHHSEC